MFNYNNLYSKVFDKTIDAEEFIIITGYIGPALIDDLVELPYKKKIYVGMYGNNVSGIIHKSLVEMNNKINISINYTSMLVHSKCYIWIKNKKIVKALIGSANFSMSGLKTPFKEVLGDIPVNTYEQLEVYLKLIEADSYNVSDYKGRISDVSYIDEFTRIITPTEVEISLLASRTGSVNILGEITNPGDVHKAAGLNWGFSNGLSLPNDAYIRIPAQIIKENPMIFPPKKNEANEYVDVIWDDGTKMQMLLEGTQKIENIDYPKQISTYKSKKELGIYLRKRIGNRINKNLIIPIESKEEFKRKASKFSDKLINVDMLNEYGRNNINIKLIGDGTYYFDFSIKEEVK